MWHAEMGLQVLRLSLHFPLTLRTTHPCSRHLPSSLLAPTAQESQRLPADACPCSHEPDQTHVTLTHSVWVTTLGENAIQDRITYPALPEAVRLRTRLQRYDSPCWMADATAFCLPCCLPGSAITCTPL